MKKLSLPSKKERHRYFGSVEPIDGTKPTNKESMKDLQNTEQDYFFHIDQVGVKNLTYPVKITSSLAPFEQQSIGSFTLTTGLYREQKGINMSRLPEILHEFYREGLQMDFTTLRALTKRLAERMEQSSSTIQVGFPWFFERKSPEMQLAGLMKAEVELELHFDKESGWTEKLKMTVLTTTLCPCSKEISEYSAHNQRGVVTVEVETSPNASFPGGFKETLLDIIESNASAKLHPVLKRPDEKKVTEQAYENPRFVEDLIRLIAADLYLTDWVKAFTIECRNEESIHQHDAYARLVYRK
jgi:GTP cyclohydrolase I